jgi:uncharacterized membrane protein
MTSRRHAPPSIDVLVPVVDRSVEGGPARANSPPMDEIAVRIQTLGRRLALLEQRTADETAAIRAELAALQGVVSPGTAVTPELARDVVPERPAHKPVDLSRLAGPTGLAVAGGVVTLLGIVFVFALAASRGWLGPAVRCSIGGGVSLLLVGLAVVIRRRYGHLVAGLAAAGAGIGGLYITLYAASRGYHLLWTGTALAAVVAVALLAAALALAWSSELLAVLGLVAVVLAPPTVEGTLTAVGLAASVVAAAAALAIGAERSWRVLGGLSYGSLFAQTVVYVFDARRRDVFDGVVGGARYDWHHRGAATAVALATAGLALAGAAAYSRGRRDVDGFVALLATSTIALSLLGVWLLLDGSGERGGVLLAIAAGYALSAAAVSRAGQRDLGVLLLALALFSAALATAFLLSNGSLAVAWMLEGLMFLALARELRKPTSQAAGLAYLGAAAVHVLSFETPLDHLFTEQAHPAAQLGVLVLLVVALAGAALLLYGRPLLVDHVDLAAAGAAALLGVYAGSLMLLDLSQRLGGGELHARFQRGETLVSALWAVVALGLLAWGLSRGSTELRYAGLALLGLALGKLFLFDLSQLSSLARAASFLAVGLTLLAGGFLVQRLAHDGQARLQ